MNDDHIRALGDLDYEDFKDIEKWLHDLRTGFAYKPTKMLRSVNQKTVVILAAHTGMDNTRFVTVIRLKEGVAKNLCPSPARGFLPAGYGDEMNIAPITEFYKSMDYELLQIYVERAQKDLKLDPLLVTLK